MHIKRVLSGVVASAMIISGLAVVPAVSSADETLINNTFDVNYDGWGTVGDLTALTAESASAHSGLRGMYVGNRQSASDGVFSNKGFYLDGGKSYDYSVWVKSASSESFNLDLKYHFEDGTEECESVCGETVNAGEWTQLSAAFTAPADALELTVQLTTDSTADFCFDDFVVTGKPSNVGAVSAAEVGLMDAYAKYFRIGTAIPGNAVGNSSLMALVLKEFNSITCENEMKPDATMNRNSSSGNNIGVSLNSCASIVNFCIENNIAVRGHTLVWHSQTPVWAFKEGFNDNGNWVSKSTMNERMESYIKNMFAAIKTQYPTLNLYAYDVVNEAWQDNGVPRTGGSNAGAGQSAWVQVYGNNDFITNAFTYARKYAPDTCKLFYNDYNEYIAGKRDAIYNMAKNLKELGVIDGIGMQSHLSMDYPDASLYSQALDKYASLDLEIQVTELDITTSNGDFNAQGQKFKEIMSAIVNHRENVTAVVFWGVTDNMSWRSSGSPLLFNAQMQEKPAYTSVFNLVPKSDWGDGKSFNPEIVITPVEPDADGYYFHTTFEDDVETWTGRGNAMVSATSSAANVGTKSASVTSRGDTWHGIARSITKNPFAPGSAYSFSTMAMYETGEATETFKLTLQYSDSEGTDHYDEVASATASAGQWVQLANTSFEIPAGATGMILYIETVDTTTDFFVDEIIGAPDGKTVPNTGTEIEPPDDEMLGDIVKDSDVNIKDLVALSKYNAHLVDFDERELSVADVHSDGNVDLKDLVKLSKYVAKLITTFD